MTQCVLTVSIDEFRNSVKKIGNRGLVKLYQDIYEDKWMLRDRVSAQQILDIARKETIIEKELIYRGYLLPRDRKDFYEWCNKINFKRKYH